MSTIASAPLRLNVAAITIGTLLFVVLLALLDGPIWLVKLVPTQDGPVHLAQSDMIARFGWGGALSGPAATFYQWNPRIEPNTGIYVLIAALIRLTGSALIANSLFLTLYGLIWIVAAYAIGHSECKRPLLAALLLLPLAFGRFIHLGFYNYALGIPLLVLFAVFWRSLAGRRDLRAFMATCVFLLALCMTHLTAAVAACLLLAADGIVRAVRSLHRSGYSGAARELLVSGIWAVAAAAPALALIVSFLLFYPSLPGEVPSQLHNISRIFGASYLYSFTFWEVVALAPMLAAVAVGALIAVRRWRSIDPIWRAFLAITLLVCMLNLGTGTASMSERLAPYTWIALVLIIANLSLGANLISALAVSAMAGLVGQSAIRAEAYQSWAPTLDGILAGGRAHPGATFINADLIPLDNNLFSWRVRPTMHIDQIAALAANGVGLSAALPSMRYAGYFPLQYPDHNDFLRAMPDWSEHPEAQAVAVYRRVNAGAPDVLIVTAPEDASKFAAGLGYGRCDTSLGEMRWLSVCTAQGR
jgi:hypothetical protein